MRGPRYQQPTSDRRQAWAHLLRAAELWATDELAEQYAQEEAEGSYSTTMGSVGGSVSLAEKAAASTLAARGRVS